MKAVGASVGSLVVDQSTSAVSPVGKGRPVDVTSLDEYEYLRPTLLKIDVEGFEVDVLRGARNILCKRPKLALEVHADLLAQYGASAEVVLDLIGIRGYRAWIQLRDDLWPVEYDPGVAIKSRVHLFCIPK
jgi:hypothetical protein